MDNDAAIIIAALLIGMVLMLLEIITPTFGGLIAAALIAFIVAILRGFDISNSLGWGLLIGVIIFIPVYLALVVKFLPGSPLGRLLFLGKAPDATSDAAPESPELSALVGQEGIAETPLRPGGAIRIDGRRIMARAERGMIDAGSKVKVIKAHGSDVVVRPMENQAQSSST